MFCFYAFFTIMSWFAYLGATHLVKKGVVELISIAPTVLSSVSAMRRDLVSIFFFFHLLILELVIGGYLLLVLVPTNKADVDSASSMALVPPNAGRVTGHSQGSTSGTHGSVNILCSLGASLGYTESDRASSMPGAYPNTVDISTAIPGLDLRNLGLTILSRIVALVTWSFDFFNTVHGLWVVPWEQPTLQLFAFQASFKGPIKHTYYAPGFAHTGKEENTNDRLNDEVKNEPPTHNPSQVNLHILLCLEWVESTAVEPTASAGATLIESDSFQDDELDRTLVEDTYLNVKRPTSAPPIMNEIHEPKCCIPAAESLPTSPSTSLESTLAANIVNPEGFQITISAEARVSHSLDVKRSKFILNADAAPFIPAPSESSSIASGLVPPTNSANQAPSRNEISAGGISSFILNRGVASFIPASQSIAPAVLPKVVEPSHFKMNADAAPFVPLPSSSALAPPKSTFGPTCLPLCPHRNDPPSYWSPGGTVIPITTPTPSRASDLHDPDASTSANAPPDFWAPGRSLDDAAIRIIVPSSTNQNSTISLLSIA